MLDKTLYDIQIYHIVIYVIYYYKYILIYVYNITVEMIQFAY